MDGLSSGGEADLPKLYGDLAKSAGERKESETGGDGRRDPRSAVFGIEAGRWSAAQSAVTTIQGDLARRQTQVSGLETEFLTQFAAGTQGTDSIK
jgi:hypothetical protein